MENEKKEMKEKYIIILDKLDKQQKMSLFLLHNDIRNIEQWLIDYYYNETIKTLKEDLKKCDIIVEND